MYNKTRGVTATDKGNQIEVNSDKYNADKAYSKAIDNTLRTLFKSFGDRVD